MSFGPWSTLPNGFPNFFGLTGQSMPKALEENARPTLDLLEWLAGANCLEAFGSPAVPVAAVGLTNLAINPPEGIAWLVRGMTIGWTTTAAQSLRGTACIARSGPAGSVPMIGGSEAASSPTDALAVGNPRSFINGPFVMWPGDALLLNVIQLAGGPINVFASASVFQFSI